MDAMPAAAASPTPTVPTAEQAPSIAPPPKPAPAQMELLKTPPPAKSTESKHSLDKTQPLHTIPAAPPSTAPQEPVKKPAPPVAPPPPAAVAAPVAAPPAPIAPPPAPLAPPPTPPQTDYVKTVSTAAVAPSAPPDIEEIRTTKPLTPVRDRLHWIGHKITTTAFVTVILPGAAAKLRAYAALTRLNKPIGVWLLMWPVLWALWLSSGGRPDPHVFIVFVLGTVLTRSAGCAINDFADRNFDGHVKRTRDRPLVTGAVDPVEAVAICAGLGLIALGLALTLNQLAQLLTLIGGVLVVTYPFFKRFFPLPQVYLGIAFTWSVPMAYAAQTGELPRLAWVMFMSGLLWTVAYDTMYAMVDREDDKKLGIRSSAILFGDADRFIIGIMQLMTLFGLWVIGDEMELGLWYGLGLAIAAMFALYQQLLIRQRKPEDCFRAFLNNNYFGMSVFIGIVLEHTFR
jgi:4-hydroxybenzoate polyprenyltransferase